MTARVRPLRIVTWSVVCAVDGRLYRDDYKDYLAARVMWIERGLGDLSREQWAALGFPAGTPKNPIVKVVEERR
jgi:hypothetical protein